jgi:hypothetical protein
MKNNLVIHASNIQGLGASHVVIRSLVVSLNNQLENLENEKINLYLPFNSLGQQFSLWKFRLSYCDRNISKNF